MGQGLGAGLGQGRGLFLRFLFGSLGVQDKGFDPTLSMWEFGGVA